MPISICQIYNDFKGANNTWRQGHFRPLSFEFALHDAQLEIFNKMAEDLGNSQTIDDRLRPFTKSVQVSIKNIPRGGLITYPKDYSRFSNLRFFSKTKKGKGVSICEIDDNKVNEICRPMREEEKVEALTENLIERQITKVDNQLWGSVCDHEFIGPSMEDPYCTQYNDGFRVLPKEIGFAVFDYIAIPERPIFKYTTDGNHNIICNASSQDLLWGEEIIPDLMSRLKKKYASFSSNSQKYAEGEKEIEMVTP
jgi:hypothetical protein